MSLLTPIHFRVPSLIFGPLVAKYLAENGVSGTFWKKYWPSSFHTWHLPLWGESLDPYTFFVFLALFSALWWPNIWPKMGFPELFEKNIGSINFIPGIYPYGVSLLNPIYFCVSSLISGPLVAKYLAENGVSGTFWKNYWLNYFFFLKNSLLCSTRLQNRNLYWIFLDEVGSDQSGGILSLFMGTACSSLDTVSIFHKVCTLFLFCRA